MRLPSRRFVPVALLLGLTTGVADAAPRVGAELALARRGGGGLVSSRSVHVTFTRAPSDADLADLRAHGMAVDAAPLVTGGYLAEVDDVALAALAADPRVARVDTASPALTLHDAAMLEAGSYPRPLKERIAGRFGHLDNEAAAGIVSRLDCTRLKHIVAAHLSQENNRPELAAQALAGALGCEVDWVGVASQEQGFGWRDL